MKLHIVFELDSPPDVGLEEVSAVMHTAAQSFSSAVSPLGACRLLKVKSARGPVSKDTTSSAAPQGPPDTDLAAELLRSLLEHHDRICAWPVVVDSYPVDARVETVQPARAASIACACGAFASVPADSYVRTPGMKHTRTLCGLDEA